MNIDNRKEYIKKYHKDFYEEPDVKIPVREYTLKLGIPRCKEVEKIKKLK